MIARIRTIGKGIFILTYFTFLINILYPSPIASGRGANWCASDYIRWQGHDY
jgi:hypothetical protein